MKRKEFLAGIGALAAMGLARGAVARPASDRSAGQVSALAITMWDFSWLERRWSGAGYEDWDVALDGLVERGYNAVRIDAFPHLVHFGPDKEWLLLPVWNQQVWGSPDVDKVRVLPALLEFIAKCHERHIRVALSSWFREDEANTRLRISSPQAMADAWISVLRAIKAAGLLPAILWVDLCNEWPGDLWAPFLQPPVNWGEWEAPHALAWITRSIELVRQDFPTIALLYSFDNDRVETYLDHSLPFDLLEHHIWMAKENNEEYNRLAGYAYERFEPKGYRNLSLKGEAAYRQRPEYWQTLLTKKIDRIAAVSRKLGKPLATTECWGLVDYKDWPLLRWDWTKDLCEAGVRHAAGTGQWMAIATSNFNGPQFPGMWRDVAWHQRLTKVIRDSPLDRSLIGERLHAPMAGQAVKTGNRPHTSYSPSTSPQSGRMHPALRLAGTDVAGDMAPAVASPLNVLREAG